MEPQVCSHISLLSTRCQGKRSHLPRSSMPTASVSPHHTSRSRCGRTGRRCWISSAGNRWAGSLPPVPQIGFPQLRVSIYGAARKPLVPTPFPKQVCKRQASNRLLDRRSISPYNNAGFWQNHPYL